MNPILNPNDYKTYNVIVTCGYKLISSFKSMRDSYSISKSAVNTFFY